MPAVSAVQVRNRNTVEAGHGLVDAVAATATTEILPPSLSVGSVVAAVTVTADAVTLSPTVSGGGGGAGLGNAPLGTAPLGA